MESKKFKNEFIDEPIPTIIESLEEQHPVPHFSILDILLIPIFTALAYFFAIKKMFPDGGNFYFFIVISSVIGLATALLRYGASVVYWFFNEKRIKSKNKQYILDLAESCEEKTGTYLEQMENCYPEITENSAIDWARSPKTSSYLTARVGTYDADNPCRIIAKDDIQQKLSKKYENEIIRFQKIENLPYVISFTGQTVVGIYGSNKNEVLFSLLVNLIAYHSANYLRMILVDKTQLLLPFCHVPNIGKDCYFQDPMQIDLDRIKKQISKPSANTFVVVLASDEYFEQIQPLLDQKNVSIIMLCGSEPLEFCDVTVGNSTVCHISSTKKQSVKLDSISIDTAKTIISSYLKESVSYSKSDLILPSYIKAEDFYKYDSILDENDDEFIIPFGIQIKGDSLTQLSLRLSDSTPHGIISGTSGSGKSELILAIVTSIALKYSPSEVNFAIIDFKSGSTSDLVKEFPHCAGIASDLEDSGSIIRAIELLKTEARRRQRILNDAVKNGIISKAEAVEYRTACKNNDNLPKLPLLVIFVDEYGNLKKQYDKFADELETITKQGRSRFMYLILADNTPSAFSSVTSNITYRICLSYPDLQSINTVLNVNLNTDSDTYQEYIAIDNLNDKLKGRGIINFDGITTAFQAPFMRYKISGNQTKLNEYIIDLRKKYITVGEFAKCILPDKLSDNNLGNPESLPYKLYDPKYDSTQILSLFPIGLCDDTTSNTQPAFRVNPLHESILISGTRLSGKTTCIKTILFSLCHHVSPTQCTVIICNFGDPRAYEEYYDMPHIANVLDLGRAASSDDKERFNRMIYLMSNIIKERSTRRENNSHRYLIVIDGYKMLSEMSSFNENKIEQLITDGKQGGISFIISTIGARYIPETIRNQFYTRILLKNNEQELETLFHDSSKIQIHSFQCGHAIIQDEYGRILEMQIQLPGYSNSKQYLTAMKDYILSYYSVSSYRAKAIPLMPQHLTLTEFSMFCRKTSIDISTNLGYVYVGLDNTSLCPVGFKITEIDSILVEGTSKSGKTTVLSNIINQLYDRNSRIIIIDNVEGYFRTTTFNNNIMVLGLEDAICSVESLIQSLSDSMHKIVDDLFIIIDDYHHLFSRLKYSDLSLFQKLSSVITQCRKSSKIHFIISYAAEANPYELFEDFEVNESILLGAKELANRFATPDRLKGESIVIEDRHAIVSTHDFVAYTKLISKD